MDPLYKWFRNGSWKKSAYPAIFALYACVVVFAFVPSTLFISRAFNRVLTAETPDAAFLIDRERYRFVAARLGISEPAMPTPSGTDPAKTSPPATTTAPLDKSALRVAVLNGTKTPGLARSIAAKLEQGGFVVAKTGNADAPHAADIIACKDAKKEYVPLLRSALGDSFAGSAATRLPEDASADCILTIGTNTSSR